VSLRTGSRIVAPIGSCPAPCFYIAKIMAKILKPTNCHLFLFLFNNPIFGINNFVSDINKIDFCLGFCFIPEKILTFICFAE